MDYMKKMKKLLDEQESSTDTEMLHVKADKVLCELLEQLGYHTVVYYFNKMEKDYG